jgi:hypothetical protein
MLAQHRKKIFAHKKKIAIETNYILYLVISKKKGYLVHPSTTRNCCDALATKVTWVTMEGFRGSFIHFAVA